MSYLEACESIAKETRALRILRFFPNADLRAGHDGLAHVAKEKGIHVHRLLPGEFLVFANKKQNKLKIYGPGNLLAYLKAPDERRLDLRVIQFIPRFFKGGEFRYDEALRALFQKDEGATENNNTSKGEFS